jgi:hypothetical protein
LFFDNKNKNNISGINEFKSDVFSLGLTILAAANLLTKKELTTFAVNCQLN